MMNLRAIQTEGAHGMNAHSQLDAAVWRDFVDDLPRLHAAAAGIHVWLEEGAIQPAQADLTMEDVEIEQQHTETFMVSPSGEPRPAERAEQKLVLRLRATPPPGVRIEVVMPQARYLRMANSPQSPDSLVRHDQGWGFELS